MKRYWFITFKEIRTGRGHEPSILEVNDVIDFSPMEYWERYGKSRTEDLGRTEGIITFAMEITEAEYLRFKDTIGNQ